MKGLIHSFESFGTKDGPGIRFVFFLQGCPLRCLYCHNPDTWTVGKQAVEMTADEAIKEVLKVKGFIRSGGITASGGEPLLQPDFITQLFKLGRENGIHTAVDTSGHLLNGKVKAALEQTDLVLLDIKHIDPDKYLKLTGKALAPTLRFIDYLTGVGKPIWARYVLVPGYSDDEADLNQWAEYVSTLPTVERVDILPFHQMGIHKWEQMGAKYELKQVTPPSREDVKRAEAIFKNYHLPLV